MNEVDELFAKVAQELSSSVMVILNSEYVVEHVNDTANRLFGDNSLIGNNFHKLLGVYVDDEDSILFEMAADDILLLDGIELFIKIGKTKKIFTINLAPFNDIYIYVELVDITAQNLLNRRLQKQIDLIEDNVLISRTDLKGVITYASTAFAKISGYTKSELIGQPHSIVRHPDMDKEIFEEMWKIIKKGKVWQGEVKNLKKNGGFYWVKATIMPDFNYKGMIIGFTSVRVDITHEKVFNDELYNDVQTKSDELTRQEVLLQQKSKNALMGEMISLITHQWKQPLSAMSLKVSDIKIKFALGMMDQKYVDDISGSMMKSVKYMTQTIDDFRDFFKPNKENELIFISNVINDGLKLLEPIVKKSNIRVNVDFADVDKIESRHNELLQVFMNLIKNAVDILNEKSIENGVINIKNYQIDKSNITEIEDNAGGVPKDVLTKIFDPYFSTKGDGGTGLGLYMSKTIVEEQLKGVLSVCNTDKGAKFTIILNR